MRVLDIIISTLAIAILGPLIIFALFITFISDFKNPLFRQLRNGKNGCFKILKIRTMTTEKEADKRRITRIGKILRILSIDELPQLINVLQGHMSIVGVRPHYCEGSNYKYRPGIIGLAQINGRSKISESERNRLNLYWDKNASVKLYLLVVVKTFAYILSVRFFKDAN